MLFRSFDDNKDETLEIKLAGVDYFPTGSSKPLPRNHVHWAIMWHLEDNHNVPCYRFLQVTTERYFYRDAEGNEAFKALYRNWGPHTESVSELEELTSLRATLGSLGLEQRRILEEIGLQEVVEPPNGEWNCQSWIRSILKKAINARLFSEEAVDSAVEILSVRRSSVYRLSLTETNF